MTRYEVHQSQLNRLKQSRKIIALPQIQPISTEASQTERHEPFDFPAKISSFPGIPVSIVSRYPKFLNSPLGKTPFLCFVLLEKINITNSHFYVAQLSLSRESLSLYAP